MKSVGRLCIRICTVVLVCSVISFVYIHYSTTDALGQQEALVKKMEALQKKFAACGSDITCQQQVAQEMQVLAQQMSQPSSGAGGTNWQAAQGEPCAMYRQPGAERLGASCLPVTVMVSDSMREEGYDVITDGAIPHNYEKRYTKFYLIFSYEAEAQGELIYNNDFSIFSLKAIGTAANTKIRELYGYRQWTDSNNHLKRRDYHLGKSTIRRPFDVSIWFPVETAQLTNMLFDPAEVETGDDQMSTVSGSQISDYSYNYGLKKQFIVTPHEMKQFVKAGGFQETFQWRSTQPNGKQWVDHQVTVAAIIGKGCDAKLSIVKPAKNKANFCYSKATPGVLTLDLEAKATPAKYAKDIRWSVPQIAGSKRTDSPNPLVGPKVTVTYSGLPEKNSEFGKKTIVAKLDVAGCTAKDEVEIKVFFPRDVTNNPYYVYPNWFYYWVQTSAATLGSKAHYNGSKCKQKGGTGVDTLGYYDSESLPDYYYICDLVQACGKQMKYRASVWEFKAGPSAKTIAVQNKPLDTEGIDTFALTTLHEAEHLTHLRTWWRDAKGNLIIPHRNRVIIAGQKGTDTDQNIGDDIPDQVENKKIINGIPVFDSTKLKTYPTIQTEKDDDDEELYTQWVAHKKFKPVDKEEDWACPGKQWK